LRAPLDFGLGTSRTETKAADGHGPGPPPDGEVQDEALEKESGRWRRSGTRGRYTDPRTASPLRILVSL